MSEEKHVCKLGYDEEPILNVAIDSGLFIRFRRQLMSWIIINDNHPKTKQFFKSIASRRIETIRHLAFHSQVIHPFSMFSLYWEWFISTIYFIWLGVLTARNAELVYVHPTKQIVFTPAFITKLIIDYILICDLIKEFFTGYYDQERSVSVLHTHWIAKHYLQGYFVVDFLPSIHCVATVLVHFTQIDDSRLICWFTELFCLVRVFRIPRLIDFIQMFFAYINVTVVIRRMFQVLLIFLFLFLYILNLEVVSELTLRKYTVEPNQTFIRKNRMKNFYSKTVIIFLVTHGMDPMDHATYCLYVIIFFSIGYWLNIYLYSQILQIWNTFSHANKKNYDLFQQLSQYMKHLGLSIQLRQKCKDFFLFKYQNKVFHEARIDMMISENLRQDITMHIAKNHVAKVELLSYLPPNIVRKLVRHVKSEVFLINDVIIRAGDIGDCMYFIYYGTVAVYSAKGKELRHMKDGDHFGEIALVANIPRVATVKAITPCELFVLTRSDFNRIMDAYPQFLEEITKKAAPVDT